MPTIDGRDLVRCELTMPRVGAWHALVEADHDEALDGSVTIEIDGDEFEATVIRGGVDGGRSKARVVGGAGGLSTELDAKNYVSPLTVRQPLTDILLSTGETLSSTVTTAILTHTLPKWQRTQGKASRAITALCTEIGATWRILDDGTLWIGEDDWDDAELDDNSELVDEDWASGIFTLTDGIKLRPGQSYNGEHVQGVAHYLEQGKLRTEARLTSGLVDRILTAVRRESDYHKLWPAKVIKQNTDKTLQVYPDDTRIRGAGGLDAVPIRHGLPGVSIDVLAGARVRVGFDGGDPKRPYAALWDQDLGILSNLTLTLQGDATVGANNVTLTVGDPLAGTGVVSVTAGQRIEFLADTAVLGGNSDYLALAAKVATELQALRDTFNSWTPAPNDGGAALKTLLTTLIAGPPAWPASVAASKAKGQ